MSDEELIAIDPAYAEWLAWVRRDRSNDPPIEWPEWTNYPEVHGANWDYETASDGPPAWENA